MKPLKYLSLMSLCTVVGLLLFTACSADDELAKEQARNEIIGSWSEVSVTEEEYISMTLEIIWTFNRNNTASQQVILSLNDYIFKDLTNTYSYEYDGESYITFTNVDNDAWTYEIEVTGDYMRLGNEEDGYFNLRRKI